MKMTKKTLSLVVCITCCMLAVLMISEKTYAWYCVRCESFSSPQLMPNKHVPTSGGNVCFENTGAQKFTIEVNNTQKATIASGGKVTLFIKKGDRVKIVPPVKKKGLFSTTYYTVYVHSHNANDGAHHF